MMRAFKHSRQHGIRIRATDVLAVLALALLLWPKPVLAQRSDLSRLLVTGGPWTLAHASGQAGKISFTADGNASMQMGDRQISPTWRIIGNGQFCLKPMLVIPERCVTLQRDGDTLIGIANGSEEFRLTRP